MAPDRKLYGSLNSPATLKVLACLFELNLEFEFVHVDLDAGEHKTKAFLSKNPFGKVPVLEEGGMARFESRAIIRSLSHEHVKSGVALVYTDTLKQAVVANWIDVEDHRFEPPAQKLIAELLTKAQNGLVPCDVTVAEAEAELAEVLDVYEARLTKFKYLVSDDYTAVDLLHLPHLHDLMATSAKKLIESRARVKEWCYEILARPAWARVLETKKRTSV